MQNNSSQRTFKLQKVKENSTLILMILCAKFSFLTTNFSQFFLSFDVFHSREIDLTFPISDQTGAEKDTNVVFILVKRKKFNLVARQFLNLLVEQSLSFAIVLTTKQLL
jgi:hypothetical protein